MNSVVVEKTQNKRNLELQSTKRTTYPHPSPVEEEVKGNTEFENMTAIFTYGLGNSLIVSKITQLPQLLKLIARSSATRLPDF